ncbi:hypothetical protein OG589_14475 [Sphaerisporangium sp. NBC_01403]|uniref:hypothetical protein n=1 Tax=Sphaerisporangium sp. NBC_01403 TaxID=2903599 RepID=UPI0032543473
MGELLTAAKLNTDLRDGLNVLLTPPLAILRSTTLQNMTNGADTVLNWALEDLDTDNGHSTVTNTSRYTAQTAGYYLLNANVTFASSGAVTGTRRGSFRKNGTTMFSRVRQVPSVSAYTGVVVVARVFLAVNDYVEVIGWQDSGGTLTTDNESFNDPRWEIQWTSK